MKNTMKIYCNYGCLANEKRNVYTFGAPHDTAVTYDIMTVAIPEGWELYETAMGKTCVTAPWGWNYDINEVLSAHPANGYPMFYGLDNSKNHFGEMLNAIE